MLMDIVGLSALVATNAGISVGIYKYFTSKIDRVYKRLDEVKDFTSIEFVKKDICKVMHENNTAALNGLEQRITSRLDKVDGTVDQNFQMIMAELLKK